MDTVTITLDSNFISIQNIPMKYYKLPDFHIINIWTSVINKKYIFVHILLDVDIDMKWIYLSLIF